MEVILEDKLVENSARVGALMLAALKELQEKYRFIGDVRGRGLMIGIELVKDKQTREPASALRNRVETLAFEHGLMILGCGETSLRLCPPLTVSEEEATVALDILSRRGVAGFTARRIAQRAGTSVPAVYELFGDKAGLVREVFYEGFRRLGAAFDALDRSDDPRADVEGGVAAFRGFGLWPGCRSRSSGLRDWPASAHQHIL